MSDRKSHCCSLKDKLHVHHQVLYHPHHHLNGQKHRDHNPHCHHHHQRQHCNVVSYGFFCSHFYPHRSQPDAFSANHDDDSTADDDDDDVDNDDGDGGGGGGFEGCRLVV